MKPPKGTFPHVVTTPREVSGSYHHQCAEQRPRTLWSTCGPLRTQADPGGPSRFHRSLERVLFRGLKSPRFLESDFKKRGGFTPDDDRLNAAASRAGVYPREKLVRIECCASPFGQRAFDPLIDNAGITVLFGAIGPYRHEAMLSSTPSRRIRP